MTPRVFDTHAHLQDDAFERRELGDVLRRADQAGVAGIVICGYDGPSNLAAVELSARYPILFPAVGFHPHEAGGITPAMLSELEKLAGLDAVVAVGEIGLDFFRDRAPRDAQRRVLEQQLEIALRVAKPVSVHTRGAEDEIADQLAPYAERVNAAGRSNPGVLHCFGGTVEQARPLVDAGFAVSIACSVTYPKNDQARRLARELPLDALVVETDCPYLPPQSSRGRRNEPANVVHAVRAIAQARATTEELVARATTASAERLFRVRLAERVGAA